MARTARVWVDSSDECRYELKFNSYQELEAQLRQLGSAGTTVVLLHKSKTLLSHASLPPGTGPVDLDLRQVAGDFAACLAGSH